MEGFWTAAGVGLMFFLAFAGIALINYVKNKYDK
jgi:hypothetical protein